MTAFSPTFEQSRRYFEARLARSLPARDKISVLCVFHGDKTPSMSVDLKAGRWFCHACGIGGGILDFERKLTGKADPECWAAINATIGREPPKSSQPKRGGIVATYDYHDAAGEVVFQSVRFEPKGFQQRQPDGKGGWIYNMEGVTRVPFKLQSLVRANVILIGEGEKDALNLQKAAAGFPNEDGKLSYAATTNIGGAGKWQDDYSPYLAGKKVFIFSDNDDPGRKHARQVCASVSKYAQAVYWVELPGFAEHGDVSDYLEKHTPSELFDLMKSTSAWSTPVIMDDAIGLKLKCGEAIVEKEQGWIVDQFLPDDTLIVVAGQVGLGKTTACLDWAASVTNGRVPIISGKFEPRNVLMLSNEDSEAQLRRIFTRLGGALSRLFVEDEDSNLPWGLENVRALETRIAELRPALVIIDSLTTHKPNKVDLNSHGDVAPMMVALRKLASQYGCAIIVIHHTNKAQTSDPLAKISGSIGISATARHVILIAQHPEDPNLRVAAIAKTNLVRLGAPSYQFRLDPFEWGGTTDLRATDLLQIERPTETPSSAAEMFLLFQLAKGPLPAEKLEAMAQTLKISRPTLYRAKKRLHIVSALSGFPAKATWSLPPQSSQLSSLQSETETTGDYSRDNNNSQCSQWSGQLSQLAQFSQGQIAETTGETTVIEGEI